MNFHPIPIEDVLSIRSRDLFDLEEAFEQQDFYSEYKEIDGIPGVIFRIELYYNFEEEHGDANSEMFSIALRIKFCDNKIIRAKFDFYVPSAKLSHGNDRDVVFVNETEKGPYLFTNFCSLADVMDHEKNFIKNGMLTVHMKGMVFVEKFDERERNRITLGQYLWHRDDRDFVICVGKEGEAKTEVKIHSYVLSSRSPVFDRMLENDMKEKAENRLEIIDFDVEVVQAAVEYFYDRDIFTSLTLNQLIDLLQFSDKYDIKDFKTEIERVLLPHLYPDTVCEIANASITSNSPTLKDLCIQTMIIYIKQGIPFKNAKTLDKDFAIEMLEKASVCQ